MLIVYRSITECFLEKLHQQTSIKDEEYKIQHQVKDELPHVLYVQNTQLTEKELREMAGEIIVEFCKNRKIAMLDEKPPTVTQPERAKYHYIQSEYESKKYIFELTLKYRFFLLPPPLTQHNTPKKH